MSGLMAALTQAWAAVARLRSLVRDDDHDDWYEARIEKNDKPPNLMGPGSQGGG